MQKIASITLFILFALSIVILGIFIVSGLNSADGLAGSKFTGYFLVWGIGLLGLAILLLLGFAVFSMIQNPKVLIRTLAIIGATVVLFFISYYFSSDTPLTGKNADVPANVLKWVGTGLNVTFFLGAFAVVSVLFTEIYRAFK